MNGQQLASSPAASATHATIPPLHLACMKGDLFSVLDCITSGGAAAIHRTISMRNQQNSTVSGITPLFLAAQRGHLKVCKLLVENGAKPNQPSYITGSTDLCTPAQVAKLNFHISVSSYLKKAAKRRKEEDAVLALDDDTSDTGGAGQSDAESESGLPLSKRAASGGGGGRAPSIAGSSRTMGSRRSCASRPTTRPAEPASAAKVFMSLNVDLSSWDPSVAPPVSMDGIKVQQQLLKRGIKPSFTTTGPGQGASLQQTEEETRQKSMLTKWLSDLDLESWKPDEDQQDVPSSPQRLKSGGLSFLGRLGQSFARTTTNRDDKSFAADGDDDEPLGFGSSLRERHEKDTVEASSRDLNPPAASVLSNLFASRGHSSLGAALSGFFSSGSKLQGGARRQGDDDDQEVSKSIRIQTPNDL